MAVGVGQIADGAGGLIGYGGKVVDVNGDFCAQANDVVVGTVLDEVADVARRPTFVGIEDQFGETDWIADPNTSGAVHARFGVEQPFGRRVVQVDRVLVGEQELDLTERVVVARGLIDLVLGDVSAVPVDVVGVDLGRALHQLEPTRQTTAGAQSRQVFVDLDAVGNAPLGLEHDRFHFVGEDRRRGFHFADNHPLDVHGLTVADEPHRLLGYVDLDAGFAELRWHPAPLLHVGEQTLDLAACTRRTVQFTTGPFPDDPISAQASRSLESLHRTDECWIEDLGGLEIDGGDIETAAQNFDMGMIVAHAQLGSRRQGRGGSRALLGLQVEVSFAQQLELRMAGMQTAQVGVGVGDIRQFFQHLGRGDVLRSAVDKAAEGLLRLGDPAAARMAGVLQRGRRQRDLSARQGLERAIGGIGSRDLEIGGTQAPIVGAT